MSKGPGRIERALAEIFDRERDNAFTLEDLRERIYPEANRTEKKHRIALARAARNLSQRRPEIQWRQGHGLGGAVVFFRHDDVMSYAMSELKADNGHGGYRNNDQRRSHRSSWRNEEDEDDLRRMLANDLRRVLEPGGRWWRDVQIFLAERDGDAERVAKLKSEREAALAD